MELENTLSIDSCQSGHSADQTFLPSDMYSSRINCTNTKSTSSSDHDLNHLRTESMPTANQSSPNMSRSLSSTSTKSISSISTACDSCVATSHKQTESPPSNNSKHNSLVICNFNTSNNSINSKSDNEQSEDEEEEADLSENCESDDDYQFLGDEIDADMISYNGGEFSDSGLASDILLAYEDEPNPDDVIESCSVIAHKKQRHILFLETHAIGKASLDLYSVNYPLIINKICTKSDMHQLNKYIFLLDQFARLCANYAGNEANIRRCSFYPFLFPHPLPIHSQDQFNQTNGKSNFANNNNYISRQKSLYSNHFHLFNVEQPSKSTTPTLLSYLDRPFVETYLNLIKQFNQSNAETTDASLNCDNLVQKQKCMLQLTHFCLKIFSQFPDLFREDLLEGSRVTLLSPVIDPLLLFESMDNYRFVRYIRTHFFSLQTESKLLSEQSFESLRIDQLFDSLYHGYNLPALFRLYHSMSIRIRGLFCRAVFRRFPKSKSFSEKQKQEMLHEFYELTFRQRKSPL